MRKQKGSDEHTSRALNELYDMPMYTAASQILNNAVYPNDASKVGYETQINVQSTLNLRSTKYVSESRQHESEDQKPETPGVPPADSTTESQALSDVHSLISESNIHLLYNVGYKKPSPMSITETPDQRQEK